LHADCAAHQIKRFSGGNPPFVISDALVSLQNLSFRLPLELHKQMKKRAKEVGITASARNSDVMADFLDNHIERFPCLFTGPGSSAVTLSVEPALVARLRDVADAKDSHLSDLVISALIVHLQKYPVHLAA
jgi:hypothetical protein